MSILFILNLLILTLKKILYKRGLNFIFNKIFFIAKELLLLLYLLILNVIINLLILLLKINL